MQNISRNYCKPIKAPVFSNRTGEKGKKLEKQEVKNGDKTL